MAKRTPRAPLSYKRALINRMQASKASRDLCAVGQGRLKWWLNEGRQYATITDALSHWTPAQIDNLLDWLDLEKIATPISYTEYLNTLKNYIRHDWAGIPPHKEKPLCEAIEEAFKKVLSPVLSIPELLKQTMPKGDAFFKCELEDWDWK